jgi:hypothetical protein
MEWCSPRLENFLFQKSENKVMFKFFDSQGIVYKEFVSPSQMVSKEYFVEVLSYLVQRIC